jgi:hypothetical protein
MALPLWGRYWLVPYRFPAGSKTKQNPFSWLSDSYSVSELLIPVTALFVHKQIHTEHSRIPKESPAARVKCGQLVLIPLEIMKTRPE